MVRVLQPSPTGLQHRIFSLRKILVTWEKFRSKYEIHLLREVTLPTAQSNSATQNIVPWHLVVLLLLHVHNIALVTATVSNLNADPHHHFIFHLVGSLAVFQVLLHECSFVSAMKCGCD